MQLLVFAVVGAVAFVVAYAFGLGGPVCALIFLAILFTGAFIRLLEPIRQQLRG